MTDYKAERASEQKVVKAALKAAGFTASVGHGRGTASAWLDVKITGQKKITGLYDAVMTIARNASGRNQRVLGSEHISVTFDNGYAAPISESDYGGAFDGFTVSSDADGGL